jgi:hypothetical protein
MSAEYRWMAEILYRDGKIKVEAFEELYELHDIIEHGPDWNSIETITVTLNRWSGNWRWGWGPPPASEPPPPVPVEGASNDG